MTKLKIFALLLFFAHNAFGQINYEPGYYVDANGQKTSGLIRNVAWKDNPKNIDFKADANAKTVNLPVQRISEFSVGDAYLYRKFDIKYDESPTESGSLSATSAPIWTQETAMLKVLSEGALILYEYNDHNLTLFFVSDSPDKTPEQLVHKEYNPEGTSILQNNTYRQQLYRAMASKGMDQSAFLKLGYNRSDMVRIFSEYNGNGQKEFASKQNKAAFHLKIVAGASSAKMDLSNINYPYINGDFEQKIVPKVGLEAEFVLPFNQKKWAILLGANYQAYKSDYAKGGNNFAVDYKFMEVPVGLRHFFYLGNKYRIFVNAGYAASFHFGSNIAYRSLVNASLQRELELSRAGYFLGGVGFGTERISAEFRYHTRHDVVTTPEWSSKYGDLGIIVSYRLF